MYEINLKHHFDACHKLNNYQGACANLHGHRWVVEIIGETEKLNNDMVIDFKILKEKINELDHAYLNEILDYNPTAENIAKNLYKEIKKLADFTNLEIIVWESPDSSISYYE
jgi:6-pyruvoyltetrahydropterin/6-carboxytetrahydropterin synthase